MWRSRKTRALPFAERQRRHMVRYLGAGQTRFGQQKRHLTAENCRWRFYLALIFAAMMTLAVAGILRELCW